MTPQKKEVGDGRDADDKSAHKGDWGSHVKADQEAESAEPTEDQLKNAQQVINLLWDQS